MIRYIVQSKKPSTHYLDIEILFPTFGKEELEVCLPVWRPGRYELGNFAKNVKRVEVFNSQGNSLGFEKIDKSTWKIHCKGVEDVLVSYSYFSFELNAGSTYVDEHQVYVNPVNCMMYVKELINLPCELSLTLPDAHTVSTALRKTSPTFFLADNFHELADSPLLCSSSIKTYVVDIHQLKTFLHLNGGSSALAEKMKMDFKKFMDYTIRFFGSCPVKEFHYLFQLLQHRFYHGVEHLKSTVIAIGPSSELLEWKLYSEILGVSCHEFFHVWNVKYIRPIEMLPYDYSRENYSRSGFVYEGFTTYYGDLLLWRSGVFTENDYLMTLAERINKHVQNFGRFNLSLADSSYDTWLDGYVPGVPHRKVSIYDEGNLFAFMLDIHILISSKGKSSLRNVCMDLYNEFGDKGRGYTIDDVIHLSNKYADSDLHFLFSKYLFDKNDYIREIQSCLHQVGLKLVELPGWIHEKYFGFKTVDGSTGKRITMIAPDSPAEICGLSIFDEIVEVNGIPVGTDFDQILKTSLLDKKPIEFSFLRANVNQKILICPDENFAYFVSYSISKIQDLTPEQKNNFTHWASPEI
jgi:predicted metalloprotease with PDZ domain